MLLIWWLLVLNVQRPDQLKAMYMQGVPGSLTRDMAGGGSPSDYPLARNMRARNTGLGLV